MMTFEQHTLARLHACGFVSIEVIMAEHVQDSVHDQQRELVVDRAGVIGRVGRGHAWAHDHVAQQDRLSIGCAWCPWLGDRTQVDVPGGRSGLDGLEDLLEHIDGLGFVHLTSRDVVRHRIVQDIVEAYDRVSLFDANKRRR